MMVQGRTHLPARGAALAGLLLAVLGSPVSAQDPLAADFVNAPSQSDGATALRQGASSHRGPRSPAGAFANPERGLPSVARHHDVEPPADEPIYGEAPGLMRRSDQNPRRRHLGDAPAELPAITRTQATADGTVPASASAAVQPAALPESPGVGVSVADSPEPRPVDRSVSPLPLAPRRSARLEHEERDSEGAVNRPQGGAWSTSVTVIGSLSLVLGLFFACAWLMRRGMPGAIGPLPKGVVEVLGRTPLPGRQQMQLLRVGNKLLLVHLSLAGAETLTEIVDPAEVDRICGLCLAHAAGSSTRSFHEVLDQLGRERPGRLTEQDYGLELGGGPAARRRGSRGRGLDA
jgi:flagellar biogenesis protein FliO